MKRIEREHFEIGETVKAVNCALLPGNSKAPPLEEGKDYKVLDICIDSDGNQHLHVGLVSTVDWVSSYETNEHLPDGHKNIGAIHHDSCIYKK